MAKINFALSTLAILAVFPPNKDKAKFTLSNVRVFRFIFYFLFFKMIIIIIINFNFYFFGIYKKRWLSSCFLLSFFALEFNSMNVENDLIGYLRENFELYLKEALFSICYRILIIFEFKILYKIAIRLTSRYEKFAPCLDSTNR
mgnify:CR=1 FL=1